MIRPIIKDVMFLRQRSAPATKADIPVGIDLADTLKANAHRCVGMAANMIGVRKTTRYRNIGVEYFDAAWKKRRMKLSGFTAQICQHELDHLSGILI